MPHLMLDLTMEDEPTIDQVIQNGDYQQRPAEYDHPRTPTSQNNYGNIQNNYVNPQNNHVNPQNNFNPQNNYINSQNNVNSQNNYGKPQNNYTNSQHSYLNTPQLSPPLSASVNSGQERSLSMKSGSQYEGPRLGSMTSVRSRGEKELALPRRIPITPPSTVSRETIESRTSSNVSSNMADFFSPEVFQIVLRNPTTAHRFLRFCQSRACGENVEFLMKVEKYTLLLDEVTQSLSEIQNTFTSPTAPQQINISHHIAQRVSSDIKQTTKFIIPSLETIFDEAQIHVERLLASEIYVRFVKHQITTEATLALADHREKFQGLGDCFCLTDPGIADNPIVFASDGFVSVTGYSRKDIIPRNCRFLQGDRTDDTATKRLKASIHNYEETVELLLNYRKNGDPFWNLLYCAPLFDERGEVAFFIGGQINCSTTIHSCTDVLRILSVNDDELDEVGPNKQKPSSSRSRSKSDEKKSRSAFFKSWRKYNATQLPISSSRVKVREEAGMENELLNRVGKMNFKVQVEAFYTAYSKYLVLSFSATTSNLTVQHYSPGVIDMLCLNLPNGTIAPIFGRDIFPVLSAHSASLASHNTFKAFKATVTNAIVRGNAVSVETGLLTGIEEKKTGGWFGAGGAEKSVLKRTEERYITHWTPLKDELGQVGWVVLTVAPKL